MEEKETLPMTSRKKVLTEQQLIDAGYTRHSGISPVDGKTKVATVWSRFNRTKNSFDIADTDGLEVSLGLHDAALMISQLSATDFSKI